MAVKVINKVGSDYHITDVGEGGYANESVVTREVTTAVPTAAGLTTGTITSTASDVFVTVTSANADHIVILPAPTIGQVIRLLNGATGYEIRSSSPTTIGINGGTGADAESAIAASVYVVLECVAADNWIGSIWSAAGVKSAVQVAG